MVRYFSHFATDPYYNMAFDEWMFEKALSQNGSIYLRLYSWDRPAVTFGFNQTFERALDTSRLGDLPVIRRVTGGRALLHDPSELTYSLAVNTVDSKDFGPNVGHRDVSRRITSTLMDFLRIAGIECEYVRQSSPGNSHPDFFHKAPCFESVARNEIVSGDHKIVASAQRRLEQTIFQHGSIKIGGVASHPAVALAVDAKSRSVETRPLTERAFALMEQQFVRAFEAWLVGQPPKQEFSQDEKRKFQSRLETVRKNCLSRRDIFKQN